MVLEDIVIPESMECHPSRMLIVGFVYSTIGMFLGYFVFGKDASISGIFLTTIPLVVIIYRTMRFEECKDLEIKKEYPLLKEHMRALMLFIYLFVGMVFSYSLWFTLLPEQMVATVCGSQMETIESIRNVVAPATTGQITALDPRFELILQNNLRVLAFCILFSFLYGSGAIFILVWNASVVGVAMGDIARTALRSVGSYTHINAIQVYFQTLPISLSYLIHGIPEILAYFTAALGGGIISIAVARHHYSTDNFKHIVIDSLDLIILSIVILVAAAFIEVYVTPVLVM
ncbi:MAG: stage II sporulation protein M [Candidatus Altiarchaeota archaeon]|nr:stage II sporulation protein M [Candidatus Altiarchaeota archaeon]